ncbi:MAG: V-type ATP synthase subunit B [Nitrospirae bacterium]|nr:V-type ATP synthase subunit B [Nitrospirota bacterium]
MTLVRRQYRTIQSITGPLLFVERVPEVMLGEQVTLRLPGGECRQGQVIEAEAGRLIIQVLQTTAGLGRDTVVELEGHEIKIGLSPELLGRRFDGTGKPMDDLPPVLPHRWSSVSGAPINPVLRERPSFFIQTGISAIDGLNTLVRGQKLPIFSGAGLPSHALAARILTHSRITESGEPFAVVFGAIGLISQEVDFFEKTFEEEASMDRTVMFLNRAGDPTIEQLLTPRLSLTVAEYLAFELDYHVLVILSDMTSYCDALREIASAREEIPGRRGYPGYLYTDLASLYERAGRIRGKRGSVTTIPILTLPDDDITHPIPDLTGYITEGQIVLSRELHRKGIFPPIDVLPSLSRLMDLGIGEGKTREDHRGVAHQLYAYYAKGVELRRLAAIVGEEGLSESDLLYLRFAKAFEEDYLDQKTLGRSIEETLNLGWRLLARLPIEHLSRIDERMARRYGATLWKP